MRALELKSLSMAVPEGNGHRTLLDSAVIASLADGVIDLETTGLPWKCGSSWLSIHPINKESLCSISNDAAEGFFIGELAQVADRVVGLGRGELVTVVADKLITDCCRRHRHRLLVVLG